MKSKNIVSILLGSALLLTACESLDYVPSTQMSSETFWKTENHARQAAVGLYAAMREPWCFGMEFTFEMCTDLADGVSPGSDVSVALLLHQIVEVCRTIGSICMSWFIVVIR